MTATAGPAGAVAQVLEEPREKAGLPEPVAAADEARSLSSDAGEPRTAVGRIAARCWALLVARTDECLPLSCLRCGEPMRIIAFIMDPPVIARILGHIGDPIESGGRGGVSGNGEGQGSGDGNRSSEAAWRGRWPSPGGRLGAGRGMIDWERGGFYSTPFSGVMER